MRFHKDGMEARRVDTNDYESLCTLAHWCGALVVDKGPYVMSVPTPAPGEARLVKDGDWIIRDKYGVFHVYDQQDWRPIVDGWPWFLPQSADSW